MASGSKKRSEGGPYEMENQYILRLPYKYALSVREILANNPGSLRDRLTLDFQADMRHAQVFLDGQMLYGKLFDLPAIIESHKTIDKKTFYKTADISQMLLCSTEPHDSDDSEEENLSPKKLKEKELKKYHWNHGITFPLKNVRKRRFRKTLQKKYLEEAPDIEKEVRRLLRQDFDAVSVRYEMIDEDERKEEEKNESRPSPVVTKPPSNQPQEIAEHDIFGEVVSSSEDEEEEAAARAINVVDSCDDDSQNAAADFLMRMQDNELAVAGISNTADADSITEAEKVYQELEGVRRRRQEIQQDLERIDNWALKQRLETTLAQVLEEERVRQEEYDQLISGT